MAGQMLNIEIHNLCPFEICRGGKAMKPTFSEKTLKDSTPKTRENMETIFGSSFVYFQKSRDFFFFQKQKNK